ncbi:helix-turn-helix domain-containing protein [Streptomyces sp. NPDC054961]
MTQSVTELSLPTPKERRRLREAAELTHEEVAAAVGVTATTVRSWETGRTEPRGRKREAYAKLLTRLTADANTGSRTRKDTPATPADEAADEGEGAAAVGGAIGAGAGGGEAAGAGEAVGAGAEAATPAVGPQTATAGAGSGSGSGSGSAADVPTPAAATAAADGVSVDGVSVDGVSVDGVSDGAGAPTEAAAADPDAASARNADVDDAAEPAADHADGRFGPRGRGAARPVGAQTRPKAGVKRAAKPPAAAPRHEARATVRTAAGGGGGLATLRPGAPVPPNNPGTGTGGGPGAGTGPDADTGPGTGADTGPGTGADTGPGAGTDTGPGAGTGGGTTGPAPSASTTSSGTATPGSDTDPAMSTTDPRAEADPNANTTTPGTDPDPSANTTSPDAGTGPSANTTSPDAGTGPGTGTTTPGTDPGPAASTTPGTDATPAASTTTPATDTDTAPVPCPTVAVRAEPVPGDATPGAEAGTAPEGPRSDAAVSAFDALYQRTAPALTRQAYLLTGRRTLAQEAVERAFQQAWGRWPAVATDPDPVGWVRAATYEYALSPWHQFRRAHKHPDKPPADTGDRILMDAMLALPPTHRRTVLLYDGVGLDLPDTAAETEASTPTAGGRLVNAHAELADRIPALAAAAPEKQSALLRERLGTLTPAVPLEPRAAAVVRAAGEGRARRWTRAAIGLTAMIAVAAAYTASTAPTEYVPPLAPGANVSGVPPHSGPQQLSDESRQLHEKLRSDPAAGPARVSPKAE